MAARLKGSVMKRLEALEKATRGFKAALDPTARAEAERTAHMLAGSLGTLGFPEGTRLAREIEQLCEGSKDLSRRDLARGSALIAALHDVLA
ncbi:MAG: Hpt domain-containing protein [Acidobacteriota bacterium]